MQLHTAEETEFSFRSVQSFCRQALPEGAFFSGFAWCCNALFPSRPSCFLLLIAHSLSFFLSRGDTYCCFARLSSLLPLMASDQQGKDSYPFSSSLWKPVSFGLINNSSPQSFCSFRSLSWRPYASEPGVCWSKYACERQVQTVLFFFQCHIQFALLREVTTLGLHERIRSVFLCFWVQLFSTHKVRGFGWIVSLCMF